MRLAGLALLGALALVAAACGDPEPGQRRASAKPGQEATPLLPRPDPAPACAPGQRSRLGSRRLSFAALVARPTVALRRPGGRPLATLGLRNVNGHRTVLGVRAALLGQDCRPAWYQVQLPLWPNGTIGYVRAGDVAVYTVSTRIEVDLSRRTLTFYRRGHPRLRVSAGIGAPRAASHGCIRLRDDVLRRLFRFTPAGTPVVIHA